MLQIKNLSIQIKDNKVIDGLNLTVDNNTKLAIIGEEGIGKTTIIKALVDIKLIKDYATVKGEIIGKGRVGYLEQILSNAWNEFSVEEYIFTDEITADINYEKYNDFYFLEKIFLEIFSSTKILEENRKIKTLSGGEKVKLQIVKILFNAPELIIFDEPTNDIDIDMLLWLENFIVNSKIPIIYTSHDETLLENTATSILHIEKRNKNVMYTYENINYDEYVQKRQRLIDRQNSISDNEARSHKKQLKTFNEIQNKVENNLRSVSRQDPAKARLLAKRMKAVKSLEKRLDEKELVEKIHVEESIFAKFHNEKLDKNKGILKLDLKELKINSQVLKTDVKIEVKGQDKLVIVGVNGSGKSTLLKIIYDELKNRQDIKVGYMPQNYEEKLDMEKSMLEILIEDTDELETIIRTYLASMNFNEEDIFKKLKYLSGGQKAKFYLTKLILEKSNVLLLDEPTRNLSPLSNPVVRKLLEEFTGSIISVSHDRKYIEEVANLVYNM